MHIFYILYKYNLYEKKTNFLRTRNYKINRKYLFKKIKSAFQITYIIDVNSLSYNLRKFLCQREKCQSLRFVSHSVVPFDGCCHAPSIYHVLGPPLFSRTALAAASRAQHLHRIRENGSNPWPRSKRKYPFRCSGRSSTPRVSSTVQLERKWLESARIRACLLT